MADISLGDVVRLKSGSPPLTVTRISVVEKHADVSWFGDDSINHATVAVCGLEIAPVPDPAALAKVAAPLQRPLEPWQQPPPPPPQGHDSSTIDVRQDRIQPPSQSTSLTTTKPASEHEG